MNGIVEKLFEAICRVGIFMICAQAILHFCPKSAYEKYLKLLVGVSVLLQLFLPVCRLLPGSGLKETAKGLEEFRTQLMSGMEQTQEELLQADALLEKMTLEEVRKRMEETEKAVQPEETRRQAEEKSKDGERLRTEEEAGEEPEETDENEIVVIVEPVEW